MLISCINQSVNKDKDKINIDNCKSALLDYVVQQGVNYIKYESNSFKWYQISNNDYLSDCLDDPYINALVTNSGTDSLLHIIYAIEREDFSFLQELDNQFAFFEYYSSPVGYSELYYFDYATQILHKSSRIEEGSEYDVTNFSIDTNSIPLDSSGNTIKFTIFHGDKR